jgi:hypothetical protein
MINIETRVNNFAHRCFLEIGDQDYISARMSYRAGLAPQFFWQGLLAIEKYIKCILLYNRISSKSVGHDLVKGLLLLDTKLPFNVQISVVSRNFLKRLDACGKARYLERSHYFSGDYLRRLDKLVWEIRRHCRVLNRDVTMPDGSKRRLLAEELKNIIRSEQEPPHKFRIPGGSWREFLLIEMIWRTLP